ncbi:MAG: hypothetical protein Q8O90_09495, partial [Elusimicrobiota bacterium]|nr:hypothetical protein [Elusimicrobiota bacterium]
MPFSHSYSTSAAAGFSGSETKLSMGLPSEIGYLTSFWTVKANPYANESVLMAQSTSSQLTTRYWNGASWQTPAGTAWWGTGGVVGIKQFDLAYFENDPTYRRGIAVYGNATSAPAFRIWYSTAAGWGGAG